MKKHNIIWSSIITAEDWEDDYRECNEIEGDEEINELDVYSWASETNDTYLDDARCDLAIPVGEIICIASLGLWDGRRMGYKHMGHKVSDCLSSNDDDIEWYCDSHNLCGVGYHHDGTNYYIYRVLKDGLSDEQVSNFENKLYYGTATKKDVSRYTRSLLPYVQKVYGF